MRIKTLCVCFFLVLAVIPAAFAGKTELTTYYPSAYGEYLNLKSTNDSYFATDSGNVGIGTTSATVKFTVAGSETYLYDGVGRMGCFHSISSANSDYLAIGWTGEDSWAITSADAYFYKNLNLQPFGGNVGIGTTNPTAKLEVTGDAKITGGLKPDYDSGWYAETNATGHVTTLTHNLGVYPTRIAIWFSTTNPPSGYIYPMGLGQMNYPQGSTLTYKNPAGLAVTTTQIIVGIYNGVYLFSCYASPVAATWYNYNTGYMRVMLWK
ncbi:MAG: hypothetical protein V1882_09620 [Candidatus Omnitrophota bacterium]